MSTEIVAKTWVGIDVSKAQLDVAIGQSGEIWSANNNPTGILKTVEHLERLKPSLVVVESTGGLEINLVSELFASKIPVALVNPFRVREFARSIGLLAKTDRLDARLLAHFAQAVNPAPTCLPSEDERLLSAIIARRHQLIEFRTAETNRLALAHESMRSSLEASLQWLGSQIEELETKIKEFIENRPEFKAKREVMTSAPGIGWVSASTLDRKSVV